MVDLGVKKDIPLSGDFDFQIARNFFLRFTSDDCSYGSRIIPAPFTDPRI
jgi:hypothetical protein